MIQSDLPKQFLHRSQQNQQAYKLLQQKYTKLLIQFNQFKQSSIVGYEDITKQLQKSKIHNEGFIKKLQKKYENLLHEDRFKVTKIKQKLQTQVQKERQTFNEIISNKNNLIERLSQMIETSQRQKSQIVDENTQNLIGIVKSEENCLQAKKYSHTELMKMYHYLLQENNCLKKQLLKVQLTKNNQKSNEKTKRNKNRSPIVYTDQTEVGSSKYIAASSYLSTSFLKRDKTESNEHRESFNNNTSAIVSKNQNKAASSNKPKIIPNTKKIKTNSSYQLNESSLIAEEKAQQKKQIKKPVIPMQHTKKTK